MNRTKVLFLFLILLVSYIAIDHSGIIQYFNDVVHEQNGWVKNSAAGYIKHQLNTEVTYHYSILKDPEAKEAFQVFQGVMKKEAVDRMVYITDSTIVSENNERYQDLQDRLKLICHYMNGNTIIINGKSAFTSVKVSRWVF
jgi:uncharacterized membrane protein